MYCRSGNIHEVLIIVNSKLCEMSQNLRNLNMRKLPDLQYIAFTSSCAFYSEGVIQGYILVPGALSSAT